MLEGVRNFSRHRLWNFFSFQVANKTPKNVYDLICNWKKGKKREKKKKRQAPQSCKGDMTLFSDFGSVCDSACFSFPSSAKAQAPCLPSFLPATLAAKVRTKYFTNPGVYHGKVPSGIRALKVRINGAGGGGAVPTAPSGEMVLGGGGGAGGLAERTFCVRVGDRYSLQIGSGGLGGRLTGAPGSSGEMSFFKVKGDKKMVAEGGQGGSSGGLSGTFYVAAGGFGGLAKGGSLNLKGDDGQNAFGLTGGMGARKSVRQSRWISWDSKFLHKSPSRENRNAAWCRGWSGIGYTLDTPSFRFGW